MGSVEHDLRIYEREQDERDMLGAMAEECAREGMKYLDSDILEAAFSEATLDDFRHLEEDLHPDTRDLAHAGLILRDIVYRYLERQAMEELR